MSIQVKLSLPPEAICPLQVTDQYGNITEISPGYSEYFGISLIESVVSMRKAPPKETNG